MARHYKIIRKLENGEIVLVASQLNQTQANKLLKSLSRKWPADYAILDSAEEEKAAPKPAPKSKPLQPRR